MHSSPIKRKVHASHILRLEANREAVAAQKITWCPIKPFNSTRFAQYLGISLAQRQLTNGGPLQSTLGTRLQKLTGSSRFVLPTASGTAALHALASAWSIKLGRPLKWATQAFTFPPAVQGPLSTSIIVDLDNDHWGPSLHEITLQSSQIDGIIVTNVFGLSANVQIYADWCKAHDKLLIFDNAATPLGSINGKCIHDYGDGAAISLHETKPLGRGEGGAVFIPTHLQDAILMAINFGFDINSTERIGSRFASNFRMSDFAAAAVLDRLDDIQQKMYAEQHESLAKYAVKRLNEKGFSVGANTHSPILWSCIFVQLSLGVNAQVVCKRLNALKHPIEAKQYYRPLGNKNACRNAWKVFESHVCLPFHFDMTSVDVDLMIHALCDVVKDASRCK